MGTRWSEARLAKRRGTSLLSGPFGPLSPQAVRRAGLAAGRRSRRRLTLLTALRAERDGLVKRSQRLPQLDGGLFLTDGGLETVLIFHDGLELSEFAAFPLLEDEAGTAALRDYYRPYLELEKEVLRKPRSSSPGRQTAPMSRWGHRGSGHPSGGMEESRGLQRRERVIIAGARSRHRPAIVQLWGCLPAGVG
jgi:hypothetical protein